MQTTVSSYQCYFVYLTVKSIHFVLNKHKPRGSMHTTLLLSCERISGVYILAKLSPCVSLTLDLHKNRKGAVRVLHILLRSLVSHYIVGVAVC